MRISFLLFLLATLSCSEFEYPQDFPIVLTDESIKATSTGVEFAGSVISLPKGHEVISYGFVWSTSTRPRLRTLQYSILPNKISLGQFSCVVDYDMVKGTEYYMRSFIKTDKAIVYGNEVSFTCTFETKPPEITDFDPKEGPQGTVISIHGENFSPSLGGNSIHIGGTQLEAVFASKNLIQAKTPPVIGAFKVYVTVNGNTVVSDDMFVGI